MLHFPLLKDEAIPPDCLCKLHEVVITLSRHCSKDTDVSIYDNDSWSPIYNLIHGYLEDILAHFKPKWHVKESNCPFVGVESVQERTSFIQADTPEPILSIKFGKKDINSTQVMTDVIQGKFLVVFL